MKDLSKIDWRSVQRYASPQAMKDFDRFLDAMPLNVGYNALIAAGIIWLVAGASVLFTSMEVEKVSKLRAELMEVEALQPPIPTLKHIAVPKAALDQVVKNVGETFKGISLITTDGEVTVSAADTDFFPQFLGAVSFLQNGAKSWKVKISTMCVGRDCSGSKLSANFKVETVRVGEPDTKKEKDGKDAKK